MVLLALLVVGSAGSLFAQDVSPVGMVHAESLPPTVKLEGLTLIWQDLNRCSPAAMTIQLSYFDWSGTYRDSITGLTPHMEDVSVRLDEMVSFVEAQGLKAVERTGGTIDLLKLLVANGFPVLVENSYYDGDDINRDWMSHNRVIMGYDDAQGIFYTFDSLLGAGDGTGRPVEYADLDRRWRAFHRDYLVIYRPEQEALLSAVMGEQHWNPVLNAEWSLAQAQSELDGTTLRDSFAAFNKGTSLVTLGRYEEAAEAFDLARSVGLPWRMMWYQFGPFEAYYHTGRYDDMITLARTVLDGSPGVEEMYYYLALAYKAQGDTLRAQSNLEVAIQRNQNYRAAIEALNQLRTELTTSQG